MHQAYPLELYLLCRTLIVRFLCAVGKQRICSRIIMFVEAYWARNASPSQPWKPWNNFHSSLIRRQHAGTIINPRACKWPWPSRMSDDSPSLMEGIRRESSLAAEALDTVGPRELESRKPRRLLVQKLNIHIISLEYCADIRAPTFYKALKYRAAASWNPCFGPR